MEHKSIGFGELLILAVACLASAGVFIYFLLAPPVESDLRLFLVGGVLVFTGLMMASNIALWWLTLLFLILGTLNILRALSIIEGNWIRPALTIATGIFTLIIFWGFIRLANSSTGSQ